MSHFFQDMTVGHEIDLGTFTFTAEHIKRYASLYDTQPFHLDEEAARNSHFGALVITGIGCMFGAAQVRHHFLTCW